MDEIKDIIKSVIGNIANKNPDTKNKIERIWLNVLEPKEIEHTRLVGVKENSLSVHVDSPAWLYQMKMKHYKILERIKDEIPEIQNIYFKIGKIT